MKAFCEECRDYIAYQIKEIDRTKEVKGRVINFKEKVACCSECSNEIFVSELRDENLATMDSAYRMADGLITGHEIIDVLEIWYWEKTDVVVIRLGRNDFNSLCKWRYTIENVLWSAKESE